MKGNGAKQSNSKEQLNFRVNKKTISELKKEAKKNNCTYRGSPSISKLLDKIGDQELVILPKQYPTKSSLNIEGEEYCINFQIESQKYPGTLARIARIFSDREVNIIGLEATSSREHGYFDIIALLPPNLEPEKILNDIETLKVGDVWQYAEEKVKQNSENQKKTEEEIREELLISEAKCSISIEVTATSRIGLLADLTQTIAHEGISLTCACRDTHNNGLSVSHFHLEWTTLERTKKAIKKLNKVPSVRNVQQTEISKIIQRFQRLHNSSLP